MSFGAAGRDVERLPEQRERSSRGRQDRRRWCRGRVGVEHLPTIRYPENLPGWVTRRSEALCGPSRHRWSRTRWVCHHAELCTQCGRIMREFLGAECPLYDAEAVKKDNDEHWPDNWVAVPVSVLGDEIEIWMPLGCTCGASSPCRYAGTDRLDENDAALVYALRSDEYRTGTDAPTIDKKPNAGK